MARTNSPQAQSPLGPPIVKGETTQVVDGLPPSALPVITPEQVLQPTRVSGEAFDDPKPGDPQAKRYRVLHEKSISSDGFRTVLHVDAVITDSTHDIVSLKKQGVKFAEVLDDA